MKTKATKAKQSIPYTIRTSKKLVEFVNKFTVKFFQPFACNQKPVFRRKSGKYKVYQGSYLSIPKGTKIRIFENSDPNDPGSDTVPVDVVLLSPVDVVLCAAATCQEVVE